MTAKRYWTPAEKAAFRRLDPHSLYIVGPDEPVSGAVWDGALCRARWGEPGGLRLVALGTNACEPWSDRITAVWNKTPFWKARLQARLWVPSEVHATALREALAAHLLTVMGDAVELHAGWVGLAPAVTLAAVTTAARACAARRRLDWCRDDGELAAECRRLAMTAAERV